MVLDGFDLGAGIVHLFVARTDRERRQVLRSIGPVWDGNEVWLLAGGGTLYFAFPALYSAAFSGFYLALMMVLWLLILRGISIELRSHVDSPLWRPFLGPGLRRIERLLALLFGAALGNVVRGVPLDSQGFFFLPLWTNFKPGKDAGIVDWYTLLIGATSFLALTVHGCYWVASRTEGDSATTGALLGREDVVAGAGLHRRHHAGELSPPAAPGEQFAAHPWGYVFPLLALAGLAGIQLYGSHRRDLGAFLSSCLYLTGMLTSAAFGVFPYVLPSNLSADAGLTVFNASAASYGLYIGLAWWIPGMLLAVLYSIFAYRWLRPAWEDEEPLGEMTHSGSNARP